MPSDITSAESHCAPSVTILAPSMVSAPEPDMITLSPALILLIVYSLPAISAAVGSSTPIDPPPASAATNESSAVIVYWSETK